jgi:hypothetical protein
MSEETNISFPNITGLSIIVSGLEIFPRDANFENETVLFDKLVIDEDMFAESIFGSVEIYDSSPNLSYINTIDYANLGEIVIKMYGDTFYFDLVDIQILTDLASKKLVGPDGRPTKVIVRFASKLFLYKNFNTTYYEDFIGKISFTGDTNTTETFVEGIDLPKSGEGMAGFVQDILYSKANANKPLNADPTFNDIWYKHDPTFYPWSKSGNTSRLSQILNYVAEYACYAYNPNAVNFFFWEDLYSYNFKCIETLSQQPIGVTFTPSLDENDANAIVSFEVINNISPSKLFDSGAFVGEYLRTKPKWDDIYSDFLDSSGQLNKVLYTYDYGTEGIKWAKISATPMINYPGALSTTVRISDNNFGYYSNAYNSPDSVWWNYYDNYNGYIGDDSTSVEPDRLEMKYWKSQFDFCELPGSWLKKIYRTIKWPLIENRQRYAYQKRLKKKWEVYKNSVCCERPIPETFFAVLTNAEKIHGSVGANLTAPIIEKDSGGVWAYEWTEVEFWPRDQVGAVLEDSVYKVIEFEDNSFPFVFIRPQGAAQGMAPPTPNIEEFPDTRAYNLNEILNSRIPSQLETQGFKTLMMNPGISDGLGITGAKKTVSSYPKNFAMMPVGKFRIISDKCPPNFAFSGTFAGRDTEFYFGGRIVQMYRIPKQTLTGIQGITLATSNIITRKTSIPTDNLYLFDVENGHDGLCIESC